jgi:hypothetical protein
MSKYYLKSKSNHHLESDFKSKSNQIKIINLRIFFLSIFQKVLAITPLALINHSTTADQEHT